MAMRAIFNKISHFSSNTLSLGFIEGTLRIRRSFWCSRFRPTTRIFATKEEEDEFNALKYYRYLETNIPNDEFSDMIFDSMYESCRYDLPDGYRPSKVVEDLIQKEAEDGERQRTYEEELENERL
ncbi:hypothetical protein C5167_033798 [Papaver somniferum]|uniref:Uncharacterized protein n=1 Tax=Papaver somniferum TaxID=3469 RepID=A0A4Y7KFC1_PAPSO|nr:uncharacterized protein LOC113298799 [Papaver somniferum]RZC70659.1 hypothetical protein C5167_033798 [Papaver somniferum]